MDARTDFCPLPVILISRKSPGIEVSNVVYSFDLLKKQDQSKQKVSSDRYRELWSSFRFWLNYLRFGLFCTADSGKASWPLLVAFRSLMKVLLGMLKRTSFVFRVGDSVSESPFHSEWHVWLTRFSGVPAWPLNIQFYPPIIVICIVIFHWLLILSTGLSISLEYFARQSCERKTARQERLLTAFIK